MCQKCPDPIDSCFQPDANYGAINERIEKILEDFKPSRRMKKKREFSNVMKLKVMQSMCSPGEPVGLLAAQVCICKKKIELNVIFLLLCFYIASS